MNKEQPVLHVKCTLALYEIGNNSVAFGINIKDQFGRTHHISIKESNKNWRGKINDIYGISLKDIFNNDNIRKYFYDGNTVVLFEKTNEKENKN